MQNLTDITGIEDTALELLEAAGFRDVPSLARAGVDPLANELERANGILKIASTTPTREEIDAWIRTAREITGEDDTEPASEAVMPVNFEKMPNVIAMLDNAPCAIPFPGRWLAESHIPVAEIAPGILLNRYAGDLEIRVEDRLPTSSRGQSAPRPASNQYVQVAEKPQMSRLVIDVSKIRTVEEFAANNPGRATSGTRKSTKPTNENAISLIQTTLESTNAGRDRNSRRYIRGVLHSDPWSVRFGALITLMLLVIMPIAVIVAPLLLLQDGDPQTYHWVRPWWVVFPFLVPILGMGWLIWGHSCSCRICRQKLFVPRKHRKNAKAHHIPLLGHILPLSVHLLLFQWFRCTHCGTPVRLKK